MDLTVWMRRFTIRMRMQGAIGIVLGMFALVGITGFLGGQQLQTLNTEFMEHSVAELSQLAEIRSALAEVRLLEKEMVINYEDGIAVLKAREGWQAAIQKTQAGLAALLQGEEDEDNALAPRGGRADECLQQGLVAGVGANPRRRL